MKIVRAFIAQFREIKKSCEELLRRGVMVMVEPLIMQRVIGVVESYNDALQNLSLVLPGLAKKEVTFPPIIEEEDHENPLITLERVKNNCEYIIELLEHISTLSFSWSTSRPPLSY